MDRNTKFCNMLEFYYAWIAVRGFACYNKYKFRVIHYEEIVQSTNLRGFALGILSVFRFFFDPWFIQAELKPNRYEPTSWCIIW